MNCSEIRKRIDDIVDDRLNELENASFNAHITACAHCSAVLERRVRLKALLSGFAQTVPEQDPDLTRRITQVVKQNTQKQWRFKKFSLGIGALAASLAVWVMAGLLSVKQDTPAVPDDLKAYTLPTLHKPHTVRLLFHSDRHIENVTFSIAVPDGVELHGYAGQQQLRWSGALKQGKNLLSLPMVAHSAISGELIMHLKHGEETKAFKVLLEIGNLSNDISQRRVIVRGWV